MDNRIAAATVGPRFRGTHFLIATLTICCLGCPRTAPDPNIVAPVSATQSEPAKPLRLIVVEDPDLAAAARRQWQARYETELEIIAWDRQQAVQAIDSKQPMNADAIIYPTDLMTALIETGTVAEMPPYVARGNFANDDYAVDDLLPVVRDVVTRWGTAAYAVPFGQPVLLLGYRADVLKQLGVEPPSTWDELSQLCELVAEFEFGKDSVAAPRYALAQPLNSKWAAATLLARAAPAAKSPARFSTLFDLRSMNARVQALPFIAVLEQMLMDQQFGSPAALQWTPVDTCDQLRQGECVFAIGWPAKINSTSTSADDVEIRFTTLPGSEQIFSMSNDEWSPTDTGQPQRVTYLPGVGRLGSVIECSRRQRAAWGLLVRLSGREWGSTVASAGRESSIFRRSQFATAGRWLGAGWKSGDASTYATAMQRALSSRSVVSDPRLLQNSRYMRELEEKVQQTLNGELGPANAMQETADAWDAITDDVGREAQSAAYHHSLGLRP